MALDISLTVGAIGLWGAVERAGAWAALLAGSVGLVVGIAFGLRYLALAGLTWRSGAGLVGLLAGLVLLAAGMGRVLRRRGLFGGLGIGLGLMLVVALFVWTVTPAVLATNVPPIDHGASTPADYGMTAREVTFIAADGTPLWAWYVPSHNGAALLLRHGAGSEATGVLPRAEVLAATDMGY